MTASTFSYFSPAKTPDLLPDAGDQRISPGISPEVFIFGAPDIYTIWRCRRHVPGKVIPHLCGREDTKKDIRALTIRDLTVHVTQRQMMSFHYWGNL
jgi:hypothetical protein